MKKCFHSESKESSYLFRDQFPPPNEGSCAETENSSRTRPGLTRDAEIMTVQSQVAQRKI